MANLTSTRNTTTRPTGTTSNRSRHQRHASADIDYNRTKLLNRLGYFQPTKPQHRRVLTKQKPTSKDNAWHPETPCKLHHLQLSLQPASASTNSTKQQLQRYRKSSILGDVVPFEAKLRDDKDHHHLQSSSVLTDSTASMSSMSSSSASDNESACSLNGAMPPLGTGSRQIQFKETVQIIRIPSRYQYSNRIKAQIWSNAMEIQDMAERNYYEFASEGFDWRNVILDSDFFVDTQGQLIHPCHFQDEQQQQLQQDDDNDDDDDMDGFKPLSRSGSLSHPLLQHKPHHSDGDDDDDMDGFKPLVRSTSCFR